MRKKCVGGYVCICQDQKNTSLKLNQWSDVYDIGLSSNQFFPAEHSANHKDPIQFSV
jgi:hypothetical protein